MRFWFHYYKAKKRISLHYRGACHVIDGIKCKVPVESRFRSRQPRFVMAGDAKSIKIRAGMAEIS